MSVEDQPEKDEDIVLAGEYALGLLSADAAAAFEARLVHEPQLRVLYAAWSEDLAGMTDGIAPVAPPAHLAARIEARLDGAAPRRRVGLGWLLGGLAAASVALLLALNAGLFDPGLRLPADPALVAQIAAEDGSLRVAAAYDGDSGALYLDRQAGAAAPGRALELWLIAGDAAPVSLGVLPEAGRAALAVPEELRAGLEGGVLAISDEPPGGSPTGAPTGAVLAVGPITAS